MKQDRYGSMKVETDLPLLVFPSIENTGIVKHGFTTRYGGVSEGIFKSLNLSFTRGDREEDVRENFRRVAEALGTEPGRFVFTDQTHTTNVRRVYEEDAGRGLTKEMNYTDIDGLVTNVPGLVLSAFFADCVPLYFVDPVNRAIGLSHSGWRGTAGRMGAVTVEKMNSEFGSKPEDLICAIGPCICKDCYEISRDVADVFAEEFSGHEDEILRDDHNGKFHLDLNRANEIVLEDAGVLPEHVSISQICTCCNSDMLFSHRATGGKRGNLGAFMALM
ncbi:MAG: peptidoglycan editing factor PgeF [Anaerovoracaceae bacterium]